MLDVLCWLTTGRPPPESPLRRMLATAVTSQRLSNADEHHRECSVAALPPLTPCELSRVVAITADGSPTLSPVARHRWRHSAAAAPKLASESKVQRNRMPVAASCLASCSRMLQDPCPCVCALVLPRALTAASPRSGKDVLDKPGLCFFSLLLSADELLLAESGPSPAPGLCLAAVPCRCALPHLPLPRSCTAPACPDARAGGRLRRCLMEESWKERSTRGQRVDR